MLITKEMPISDTVRKYPGTAPVFMQFGMGCLGCAAAHFENLEAGAKVHGFDPDAMVDDINALIEGKKKQVLYLDCLFDEVYGSINSAYYDGCITKEQADYLRQKYLRMEAYV